VLALSGPICLSALTCLGICVAFVAAALPIPETPPKVLDVAESLIVSLMVVFVEAEAHLAALGREERSELSDCDGDSEAFEVSEASEAFKVLDDEDSPNSELGDRNSALSLEELLDSEDDEVVEEALVALRLRAVDRDREVCLLSILSNK
jgi:hypothetical protein